MTSTRYCDSTVGGKKFESIVSTIVSTRLSTLFYQTTTKTTKMGRGKELSPQIRSRICELYSLRIGPTRIHRLHPEIPLSTIKTTIRREATRVDNQTRPRSGAPRKITEEQRDQIYDEVMHKNPHVSHRDLLDSVDNVVKARSLRGLLREMDRRKWRQLKRPQLTQEQADARLPWAKRCENYTEEDWKRLKWSDECTVERGVGKQPIWTFLRPCEQLAQHDVQEVLLQWERR